MPAVQVINTNNSTSSRRRTPKTKALQNETSEHRAHRLRKMREYRARTAENRREYDRQYRRKYYWAHTQKCAAYMKDYHVRKKQVRAAMPKEQMQLNESLK